MIRHPNRKPGKDPFSATRLTGSGKSWNSRGAKTHKSKEKK